MQFNFSKLSSKIRAELTLKRVIFIIVGSAIFTFGIHNIHSRVDITEGGIIGLMLLIEHWTGLSPALITPVLDCLCYVLAFKFLGSGFIIVSAVSTLTVSLFYKLWELLPFMLPDLSELPLLAAVLGALFVGIGVGLIIRHGGSSSGDDALALIISKITKCKLAFAYMFADFTVSALSLTYIPLKRIAFSLITVTLSSLLVEFVQKFKLQKK